NDRVEVDALDLELLLLDELRLDVAAVVAVELVDGLQADLAGDAGADARVVAQDDLGRLPPVEVRGAEAEAGALDRVGPEGRLHDRPEGQLRRRPLLHRRVSAGVLGALGVGGRLSSNRGMAVNSTVGPSEATHHQGKPTIRPSTKK